MKIISIGFLLCFAGAGSASAADKISRMQCPAADGGVITLLEINATANTVLQSAKFTFDGHVNGPFGPYVATITKDAVKWRVDASKGRVVSITNSSVNLRKNTLDVVIDNGPGEDGWKRLNTPCTIELGFVPNAKPLTDDEERAKLLAKAKTEIAARMRGAGATAGPGMTAFEVATEVIRSHGFNCPKMISLSRSGQDEVGDVYLASCAVPNNALNYTLSVRPDGTNRVVFTGKLP